jgi:hypothetical protein
MKTKIFIVIITATMLVNVNCIGSNHNPKAVKDNVKQTIAEERAKEEKEAKNKAMFEDKIAREHRIRELKKKIYIPEGYDERVYIDYLALFGVEWDDCVVTNPVVIKEFEKYFNKTPYRVIWDWDIDGDGRNEYLAVEVYNGVRRGIKRGIVVDDAGTIELYIDTIKGVYTKEYMVIDLKYLGLQKGEVECYSIGYLPYKKKEGRIPNMALGHYTVEGIKEHEKEIGGRGNAYYIGGFFLQALDKDLKVIGAFGYQGTITAGVRASYWIHLTYIVDLDKVVYELFTARTIKEDYIPEVKLYRKVKKEGKIYGPPKEINKEEARIALETLMLEY